VQFRSHGNSMTPRIKSGQLLTLAPVKPPEVSEGDAVLCKVRGHWYVHLVTGKRETKGNTLFKISNNHGHDNGWTSQVYGKVVKVED
jgi:hypothetical protein